MGLIKNKKLGVLFTGGKDSCYAMYLVKKQGFELACLISLESENPDSFMFHTPSISQVKKQADVLGLPLIIQQTKGEKEEELNDLDEAIKKAKNKFGIFGIVTGAIESVYQSSRIKKICDKYKLECINPLWHKDQINLLNELIENNFEVVITGVAAYPLTEKWIGRKIDKKFVEELKVLQKKYKINPAGEGGEFESFVLNCPMFKHALKIASKKITGSGNSFRMDLVLE
jgi:asparagine synthase (glutamine-hydrolysing)